MKLPFVSTRARMSRAVRPLFLALAASWLACTPESDGEATGGTGAAMADGTTHTAPSSEGAVASDAPYAPYTNLQVLPDDTDVA